MFRQRQTHYLIALGIPFVIAMGWATPSHADPALEKIARTGTLVAGTTDHSFPFGFRSENGEWVGYSIDVLHLIEQRLEEQLNQSLELTLVPVSSEDWISKLTQGDVDLVCSVTTQTSSRAATIDFTRGYFLTGTQLLTRQGDSLSGRSLRIGYIPGTSNQHIVQRHFEFATFVEVPSRPAGLEALQANQIDAFASDGVLLEGLRHTAPNPEAFTLMPSQPLTEDHYACMLPKANPDFKALVNEVITDLLNGILTEQEPYQAIARRWFGASGALPLDSAQLRRSLQQLATEPF